jgi:shikimate dehydrogenase
MTDQYAVIGNPIAHSKSPLIHKMFAEQTGQDIRYEKIESPLDGFADTIARLRGDGYKGCNVTVPFKFEAFQLCNQLTGRARAAQAVNTLLFQDGEILGDNTDGAGLIADIEQNLGYKLLFKKVLLMGAGGAAHGVIWQLFNAGASIVIANRTLEKAQQLASEFTSYGTVFASGYEALAGKQFDVVINATSSSLSDKLPPLPRKEQIPLSPPFTKGEDAQLFAEGKAKIPHFEKGGLGGIFAPDALAYDMMYGKQTPFLKFSKEQGVAQLADGLGMLVEQAAEAFFKWRGVRPETAPVLAKLRLK